MQLKPKTLEKLRLLINEETEYRSGPKLVSFFNGLGFNDSYSQVFPPRWLYTDEKLTKINGTADMDKCIRKLFSPICYLDRIDELDSFIDEFNKYLAFDKWQVIRNNDEINFSKKNKVEIKPTPKTEEINEAEFMRYEFNDIDIDKIGLSSGISNIIKLRLDEIEKCIRCDSPLAVIFLCGSTLEGMLLDLTTNNIFEFNKARGAPIDKDGKVKKIHKWTLNNLIDVAYELGFIKEDAKKFSHNLRDFRNYIHPYQQLRSDFNPDQHTAKISWQVLKAVIYQIGNNKYEQ